MGPAVVWHARLALPLLPADEMLSGNRAITAVKRLFFSRNGGTRTCSLLTLVQSDSEMCAILCDRCSSSQQWCSVLNASIITSKCTLS